jgi:hypothetical protein
MDGFIGVIGGVGSEDEPPPPPPPQAAIKSIDIMDKNIFLSFIIL